MPRRELWRFDAIGTTWEVETADPVLDPVRRDVASVIARFDATWSRFREDSRVMRLAREGGLLESDDAGAMFDLYADLSDATAGAVNPVIAESLDRRGYDREYSFVDRGAHPADAGWRDVLAWESGHLEARVPVGLDVGALGKGRLVDLVLQVLVQAGVSDVVVDASGDLAARGAPQRIGLEHPYDSTRAIGVWEVTDAALCASATNRRAWGDGLHHVLDARTGEPVETVAATWVVAGTAMIADALATALFFDGGARLAHDRGASWVRMMTDGRVEWSPGCAAELFLARTSVES